jgi:hypothetical protein
MRAKWLWMTWLASLAAACGEGHAIFNVDVYSFLKGTGDDSIAYFVPPGPLPDSASSTPRRIDLPGAGSSIVDSVLVNGKVNFDNQAGTGTIGLQLYLDSTAAGTMNASALAFTVPDASVSNSAVTSDTIIGRLSSTVISLLAGKQIWVRFQAKGSNSGAVLLQGSAVLKGLRLTVVMSDKFF